MARLNRFNGGTCSSWQSCRSIEKVNRLVAVYSARSRDSRRVNGSVESSWQTGRHVFVSTNGLGKNKVERIDSGARGKARTHGQIRNGEKSPKIILTMTDGVDRWMSMIAVNRDRTNSAEFRFVFLPNEENLQASKLLTFQVIVLSIANGDACHAYEWNS